MGMRTITILTDFAMNEYVAQMKGVMMGLAPEATIVDICHDIAPQDIFEGGFVLMNTVGFFEDAVHLAVVDPGVGSDRNPIVVDCERGVLVGPDNGLLYPAANRLGFKAAYRIQEEGFMLPEISDTFHGRDIFAPVAGHLASGKAPSDMGPRLKEMVKLNVEWHKISSNSVIGRIGRVDGFGNVITNIPRHSIEPKMSRGRALTIITLDQKLKARFVNNYSEGKEGVLVALFSSSDHLEISINGSRARDLLSVTAGDKVKVLF